MSKKNEESLAEKGTLWRTKAIELRRYRRLNENERALIELIQSLDSKYDNLLVVVEGKRDVTVLRNLGLEAPIVKTQTRLSKNKLIDSIMAKAGKDGQVLILTDFDRKGKEIHKFIETELELSGTKILKRERRMIRKYMDTWICIEQLVSLFKRSDSPEAIDPQSIR
ncbi:MAG: toprim domain-containing protein [Candidatus Thorarchaeota archaeon]